MAIYQGDKKISGNAKVSSLPLFTTQWQDHITNDASWVRSETFSWQSGAVYVSAYNHLVADISGITSETETVAGTTITFYRATDGHKIVLPDQETNVSTIYTATGIAWYYILDTTNQRFKLPRSKWNFVGLRDNVGNYVSESLPNITGDTGLNQGGTTGAATGAFAIGKSHFSILGSTDITNTNSIDFDASRSSSTYQDNAPVQQRATQMYLYFYVGNTVQDQTTIDVGEITEELNDKADADLANLSNGLANTICTTTPTTVSTATSARPAVVVENYVNGTSWYRVYSDGWCEQGGVVTGGYLQVYFLKPYANANYNIQITLNSSTEVAASYAAVGARGNVTSTYFELWAGDTVGYKFWRTCGYISLS